MILIHIWPIRLTPGFGLGEVNTHMVKVQVCTFKSKTTILQTIIHFENILQFHPVPYQMIPAPALVKISHFNWCTVLILCSHLTHNRWWKEDWLYTCAVTGSFTRLEPSSRYLSAAVTLVTYTHTGCTATHTLSNVNHTLRRGAIEYQSRAYVTAWRVSNIPFSYHKCCRPSCSRAKAVCYSCII